MTVSIEVSSGGVSKSYRYYPQDALYVDASGNVNTSGNGRQVTEAWVNGEKCYPDVETCANGTTTRVVVAGGFSGLIPIISQKTVSSDETWDNVLEFTETGHVSGNGTTSPLRTKEM